MPNVAAASNAAAAGDAARAPHGRRWIALAVVFAVLAVALLWLRGELRAYAVLTRFVTPQATGLILRWETNEVTTQDVTMATSAGPVPAKLYLPSGVPHPPGIVVIHGIHHLGIYDPRFVNFARALAGTGFAVLTPVISALADYHVDAGSIPTIGESAAWLEQRLGTGPITMFTLSFSGGLALLAACDDRYAPHMRELVVFGGYDNLARVSRFLATDEVTMPDGRTIPFKAHDYGASVFIYAHLPQFFAPADLPAAREALKNWLWEKPEEAKPWVEKLSPEGRATMDALMARRIDELRPRLLQAIQEDGADLAAISPQGKLAKLRVPVFIVHGSSDNVIPYTESLWLERDVPRSELRGVLITPAFTHVDPNSSDWLEQLRLVDFMARIFGDASH
jgi:pimeloyl-ACP methyl ester carboxylesterase